MVSNVMQKTPVLLLFTLTLFLSAFLLFCVQPMIAKMILPLLGGSPAVWSTCMVFFQAMLLAGYAVRPCDDDLAGRSPADDPAGWSGIATALRFALRHSLGCGSVVVS